MTNAYYLTFADGYKQIIIGSFDEMIAKLDYFVTDEKHGRCTDCKEHLRYDRYTGSEFKKIW